MAALTVAKHALVKEGDLAQYLADELADTPARHLNSLASDWGVVTDRGFGVSFKKDPAAAGGANSHRIFDVVTEDGTLLLNVTAGAGVGVHLMVPEADVQDLLDAEVALGRDCVFKRCEYGANGARFYDLIFYATVAPA